MNVPTNVKYSTDHEWLKIEGEFGYVGLSEYATDQLGDIVFLDINTIGEILAKDEPFGSVEAVKTVSDMLIPVSCEVIEFNDKLEVDPGLLNTDPYGEGWIVKIKLTNDTEVADLMDSEAYKAMIGE
ncbi:MAG: glycine cleavage system protein GcvH [Bacteroidales bacterium]|jgi:glycine cleavage system H protein|nr:glycine cleavage system protein GcvH [Bacteroidales bacterium]